MKKFLVALATSCLVLTAHAQPLQDKAAAADKQIRAALKQSRPDIRITSIEPSPIGGLYTVQVTGGPQLYITADGSHFVLGDLFAVQPGGFVNLAEQVRNGDRAKQLATVDAKDMIVFPVNNQPAKARITVFTDVDCYYCQKLHQEVPDLQRIGIEVRYMAYPRAGVGSESYKKIASAWCADDKQEAMTKLKQGKNIPINVCADNPVAAQFKLGGQMGVTGTPAMISDSGQLMPGYMPALQLAQTLGVEVEPELAQELAAKMAAQQRKR